MRSSQSMMVGFDIIVSGVESWCSHTPHTRKSWPPPSSPSQRVIYRASACSRVSCFVLSYRYIRAASFTSYIAYRATEKSTEYKGLGTAPMGAVATYQNMSIQSIVRLKNR